MNNMDDSAIELSDIVKFVGKFVRPKKLGEELARSKHHFIQYGQKNTSDDSKVCFIGLCLTSKIKEKPHSVEVTRITDKQTGAVSLQGKCSCKAGSGRCKHVVGLMLKLQR